MEREREREGDDDDGGAVADDTRMPVLFLSFFLSRSFVR